MSTSPIDLDGDGQVTASEKALVACAVAFGGAGAFELGAYLAILLGLCG